MSARHEPATLPGPDDEELAGAVVGRALHALEPDDEDLVAEHLRTCGPCRSLLDETHRTMATLAHTVPAVDPPDGLRDRLLAAAAREPEPPRATGPDAPAASRGDAAPVGRAAPAGPAAPRPRPDTGPATPPGDDTRGRGRRAAAVFALAAVVAGVVVFSARDTGETGGADPRSVLAQRAEQVVDTAEARDPATRHASLVAPGRGVMAVVLDDAAGTRIVPLDVPDVGADRSLVLWRITDGSPRAVGTFTAEQTGLTTVPATTAPGPPGGNTSPAVRAAYAVSVEPAGPVPAEPSDVLASGPLV